MVLYLGIDKGSTEWILWGGVGVKYRVEIREELNEKDWRVDLIKIIICIYVMFLDNKIKIFFLLLEFIVLGEENTWVYKIFLRVFLLRFEIVVVIVKLGGVVGGWIGGM